MKREELLTLGLTPEQIKGVQVIHAKDLHEFKQKEGTGMVRKHLREAIAAMLPTILQAKNLKLILSYVNHLYYMENRSMPEKGKEAATVEPTNNTECNPVQEVKEECPTTENAPTVDQA